MFPFHSALVFIPFHCTLSHHHGPRSTGKVLHECQLSSAVDCVCFSPDGTLLAAGSMDKSVSVWDTTTTLTDTGEVTRILWLEGHEGGVKFVCFSPDGRVIASGSEDKTIRLWVSSFSRIWNSHTWRMMVEKIYIFNYCEATTVA